MVQTTGGVACKQRCVQGIIQQPLRAPRAVSIGILQLATPLCGPSLLGDRWEPCFCMQQAKVVGCSHAHDVFQNITHSSCNQGCSPTQNPITWVAQQPAAASTTFQSSHETSTHPSLSSTDDEECFGPDEPEGWLSGQVYHCCSSKPELDLGPERFVNDAAQAHGNYCVHGPAVITKCGDGALVAHLGGGAFIDFLGANDKHKVFHNEDLTATRTPGEELHEGTECILVGEHMELTGTVELLPHDLSTEQGVSMHAGKLVVSPRKVPRNFCAVLSDTGELRHPLNIQPQDRDT